ncbi:MAG: DUF507 family protein [Deltaproteobacteria bacterium]|nr:DUF507 family protein [Deltaproteobacteria bacterium]
MKLAREQVEKLSGMILDGLVKKGLIVLKTDREAVLKKIVDVITADLKVEDDLEKEVETILSSHSGDMDSSRVDYRRMFNMIKQKLARERGIVL